MSELPPLPYSSQWIDEADIEAVARVLRSDWLTTGPCVDEFERALIGATGCNHAVAVNSGTAALHTAYTAAGLGVDEEIITSPLTFVATASAALLRGARVVFADVDPTTGNVDPRRVEDLLTDRVRLIVAVDYAGHPADYHALGEIARDSDRTLVADASHSLGASFDDRRVGSLADITTLSFHPVKSITTGEGGAVLTLAPAHADAARIFRNHGIIRDPSRQRRHGPAWYYEIQSLGMNYRIPDILCALGTSQLHKLDTFVERRRALAARYGEAFADLRGIATPSEDPRARSSWHLYVIRVDDAARRDALFDALRAAGIQTQVHYMPVHLHPAFADLGYREGLCPEAERFAARALSLPLYPRMSDADADRVIDTVRRCAATTL